MCQKDKISKLVFLFFSLPLLGQGEFKPIDYPAIFICLGSIGPDNDIWKAKNTTGTWVPIAGTVSEGATETSGSKRGRSTVFLPPEASYITVNSVVCRPGDRAWTFRDNPADDSGWCRVDAPTINQYSSQSKFKIGQPVPSDWWAGFVVSGSAVNWSADKPLGFQIHVHYSIYKGNPLAVRYETGVQKHELDHEVVAKFPGVSSETVPAWEDPRNPINYLYLRAVFDYSRSGKQGLFNIHLVNRSKFAIKATLQEMPGGRTWEETVGRSSWDIYVGDAKATPHNLDPKENTIIRLVGAKWEDLSPPELASGENPFRMPSR